MMKAISPWRLPPFKSSLRTSIAVPFTLVIIFTVALQSWTLYQEIKTLTYNQSVRLLDAISIDTSTRLKTYLSEPFLIQRNIADDIAHWGLFTPGDMRPIYEHLKRTLRDLQSERKQISVLAFGAENGESTAMRREDDGSSLTLIVKDKSTQQNLNIYESERPAKVLTSIVNYDPRTRPWYAPFIRDDRAGWTEIYSNVDERTEVTVSASSPVKINGKTIGVTTCDVKLNNLNTFLKTEPLRGKGIIFITEADGRLVAQSENTPYLADGHSDIPKGQRLLMSQSNSPHIRNASDWVLKNNGQEDSAFELTINDSLYFGRVTPFKDAYGLDWRIVILFPEAGLLGDLLIASKKSMLWIILMAVTGLVIGLWIIQRITQAIERTARAATALAEGKKEIQLQPLSHIREIEALSNAFNYMTKALRQAFHDLHQQVVFDSLTKLLSRQGFLDHVKEINEQYAVLCLVDLSEIQAINEQTGFETSNGLLQSVAHRMQERLPSRCTIARLEQYVFAVMFSDLGEKDDPNDYAKLLHKLFDQPFSFGVDEVKLQTRIGYDGGWFLNAHLNDWLRNATAALTEAQRLQTTQAVRFSVQLVEQSSARNQLARELQHAITTNQLKIQFQPIVELGTQKTIGTEALLYWDHPQHGVIKPEKIIQCAEEFDLILQLGDWVLLQATQAISGIQDQLPENFSLHVNISGRHLIQSDFVARVAQALWSSGLPAAYLTLELTEAPMVEQTTEIESRLAELQNMGVQIAIDDISSGHWSLTYLSRWKFDCLKIRLNLSQSQALTAHEMSMLGATLGIAQSFALRVIPVGVETHAQMQTLQSMGLQYVQGFYFAKPLPLAEINWQSGVTPSSS